MPRRREYRPGDRIEATVKLVLALLMLAALGVGGITHFVPALLWLIKWIVLLAVGGGVIGLITALLIRHYRATSTTAFMARPSPPAPDMTAATTTAPTEFVGWTIASIRQALDEIDWYQFEKFCAALLQADGFSVTRKGGAQPDGGVDLIVEQNGASALIQCKHWRTWEVKEGTVREMLGSMTAFNVKQGAIYTLKGWTKPAEEFGTKHEITLVNGDELAQSAKFQLTEAQLDELLRPRQHHCPKCEAPMILREGNFPSFWGCSRYPICRAKLHHRGAG